LPISKPGSWYHLTARGNELRAIYRNDEDRRKFLALLEAPRHDPLASALPQSATDPSVTALSTMRYAQGDYASCNFQMSVTISGTSGQIGQFGVSLTCFIYFNESLTSIPE